MPGNQQIHNSVTQYPASALSDIIIGCYTLRVFRYMRTFRVIQQMHQKRSCIPHPN